METEKPKCNICSVEIEVINDYDFLPTCETHRPLTELKVQEIFENNNNESLTK